MADTDQDDVARDPASLTLAEIMAMSPDDLERYRVAALAQIAFDSKAPAAARVAALRDLGSDRGPDPGDGDQDPGGLDLEAINRELAALG